MRTIGFAFEQDDFDADAALPGRRVAEAAKLRAIPEGEIEPFTIRDLPRGHILPWV
ncbi:hypothetical protein D9M68_922660 [compost metagenome]